jgi:hypothetical protein
MIRVLILLAAALAASAGAEDENLQPPGSKQAKRVVEAFHLDR